MSNDFKNDVEVLKAMHVIVTNMVAYDDEATGLYDYWAMEGIPDDVVEDDYKFIASNKDMLEHVTQVFIACCRRLNKGIYYRDNNLIVKAYKGNKE